MDVREGLKRLPDESVDCCITSPPYWGLRDYGTAKWEGGDEKCDHRTFDNDIVNAGDKQKTDTGSMRTFKDICRRCGAKRIDAQIGLEKTPEEYVAKMVEVFREVKRVLKKEGTLWLNLGDSYAGSWGSSGVRPELDGVESYQREKNTEYFERRGYSEYRERPPTSFSLPNLKPKDLCGIPWRVAFALQADGWWLRQDIIWHKPNPMPESVTDRCTKAHEYVFLIAKSAKYYYDNEAIKEKSVYTDNRLNKGRITYDGKRQGNEGTGPEAVIKVTENRNKRSVWTITTKPFKEAHFATFPPDLITPMVLAGCPKGGIVLDPFVGSGTTLKVARDLKRNSIGIELNPAYVEIIKRRLFNGCQPLTDDFKIITH